MRFIYKTENPVEAHIITHMLEQNGIMAQVIGEHLYMSHMTEGRIVKISVIDNEAEDAIELIKSWKEETEKDSQTLKYEEPIHPSSYLIPHISKGMIWWISIIIGAILAYYAGL